MNQMHGFIKAVIQMLLVSNQRVVPRRGFNTSNGFLRI